MAWVRTILSSPVDSIEFQRAHSNLYDSFNTLLNETKRLDEILLVNLQRSVPLSTDPLHEGSLGSLTSSVGSRTYFIIQTGLRGDHGDLTALTTLYQGFVVIVVKSIHDEQGKLIGLLVGHAGSDKLNDIMLERAGLGETGETYLANSNGKMLTMSRYQASLEDATYSVMSENYDMKNNGPSAALYEKINGSGLYTNYHADRVIGVYRWLSEIQAALVAEQTEREAMKPVYQMVAVNLGVALTAALIAGIAGLFIAQTIVRPLGSLAQTAERVTRGELGLAVPVERKDEIGALARAFNIMTARMQEMISGLEKRVSERTVMLRQRAVQLETSVQVGREITSILDVEELLIRVTSLIATKFGYYHVGICLVDRETGKLIFRAGAGKVARPSVAQTNPLEVGITSLNTEAVKKNKTIVVNNVSDDARFYYDDNMKETRSELVVPLRVGDRVIGTLDVQSSQTEAFSEDDALIIQGLADQVAIAIENARHYRQARQVATMEERQRMARELHDSVTQSLYSLNLMTEAGKELLDNRRLEPLAESLALSSQTAHQALKEMRLLVFELRPLALEEEGLLGALHQRLDAVERRTGIQTRLLADDIQRLPAKVEEELYRIALEALNNSLKHAKATTVSVHIRTSNGWVELEIVDNGIGFDPQTVTTGGGMGLHNMEERAKKIGGFLQVISSSNKGTRVIISGVRL